MTNTSIQPLLRVVELGMDVCALREKDKHQQTEQEASPYTSNSLMPGFIHSSPAMTALVEEVYKIRSSDVTVLVTGESGTGKELVSRAIHTMSNRKDKVFIPFNCTAVPKELAEGHLFGYRKGAFTGAVNDSQGMIRAADGGTLFLDEIGDLPIDVQPKLLRFLQEGEVQPIGEKSPIKVDVRMIAATNMPLRRKSCRRKFPRRSILSTECHSFARSAASGTAFGNSADSQLLHQSLFGAIRQTRCQYHAADDRSVDGLRMGRQCPPALQRDSADRGPRRRRRNHHAGASFAGTQTQRDRRSLPLDESGNVKPITSFDKSVHLSKSLRTAERSKKPSPNSKRR